jgi:hypothetical protein
MYEVAGVSPACVNVVDVEFVNVVVDHTFEFTTEKRTAYPVIALPPLLVGAVHETASDCRAPLEAETAVGAPGTVNGVSPVEFDEFEPVPTAFLAATRKRYAVPLVSPVTVTDVAVETVSVNVVQVLPLLLEY